MTRNYGSNIKSGLTAFFKPMLLLVKSIPARRMDFLLFLLIPVIFLSVVTLAHHSHGPFYMRSVDPEYFYLYNGILLGAGNLSIQYYAHPGTPLHFIIAISARITDLFQPGDYMKNFVDDPEKYIHAASLFLNILIAISLFICGKLTLKYTGSRWAAIFMQLAPFASFALLSMSGRLTPEAVMMIPMLFLCLMVIKNTFQDQQNSNLRRDIILYGLIIGFGMACKLTFSPVIILPLILLKAPAREKLMLLFYTILFFALFAYPVIFNIGDSWKWFSGIFTHSGKYGTGEADFMNFSSVGKNFAYLFNYNSAFFYILFSAIAVVLVFLIPFFKKKLSPDARIIRAIISLVITIIVCIALILKHYELYYFMPFTLFKLSLFMMLFMLITRLKPVMGKKILEWPVIILAVLAVAFILAIQVGQFRTYIADNEAKEKAAIELGNGLNSIIDQSKPMILAAPFYGSPFIEFAQFNGFSMSGKLKGFYKAYLKQKYPNYYNFVDWSDKFDHWDDFVDFKDILSKVKSSFYVYTGKGKSGDLEKIEKRISQSLDLQKVTTRILFRDPETGEQLTEIIINP